MKTKTTLRDLISFLLFISLFFSISCKTEDEFIPEESNTENILNDNAFLLDSTKVISSNDTSFILSKSANRIPKIGEIILSGPSTNCPNGMLRRIVSSNESGSEISYQTEQSSLNEAFKQLFIDHTYSETYSESSVFSKTGNGTDLTLTFNNKSVGNGVKLNGQIKLKYPTTTFKYQKLPNSYDPKLIILKTDISVVESNLEMSNSNSSPISISKFILTSYDLPPLTINIPIPTPIGIPFPLPVKFKQKIDFEILPFEINGKFNFKVLPSASASLGVQFDANAGWSNISTYNFNATTPSTFSYSDYLANGSINAQLTIFNPKYSISPMFVDQLKGTLEFPTRLNLKVQGNQPNYSLRGSVGFKAGIEQKFFRNLQGNYSITGNLFETTILEGNWDNLIVGTWKMSGNFYNGVDVWNLPIGTCQIGTDGSCTYSIPQCVRDDSMQFKNDNSFISDEGLTKCNPNDPQTQIGNYLKNGNQLTINLNGNPITYNILQLDSTTLKIQQTGTNGYEIYTKQ